MSETTPPSAEGPQSAPQENPQLQPAPAPSPLKAAPEATAAQAQPAPTDAVPQSAQPVAAEAPALQADAAEPQAPAPAPPTAAEASGQQAPAEPLDHEPAGAGKVVVRYGIMNNIGEFRHNLATPPRPNTKVVIRTERGVELGTVLTAIFPSCEEGQACHRCVSAAAVGSFVQACGDEYPYRRDGKILRLANTQDVNDQRHLDSGAREEATFCRHKIAEMRLPMRLVTVEHLLGGERIIFYFSSEARVDFRELVRGLATQYRTRIEMHQVGARDEARLVADYERCGQRCCCQQFLKNLQPVSMRMAKTQKATLDPTKISGRCGRLMCCLRYEDDGYEELRKKLPRKNIWVRTAAGVVGRVIDTQIITQLVRIALVDNSLEVIGNEDIVERNVEAPPLPAVQERPRREPKVKAPPRLLREEFQTGVPQRPAGQPVSPQAPQAAELPQGAMGEAQPAFVEVTGPAHVPDAPEDELDPQQQSELEELTSAESDDEAAEAAGPALARPAGQASGTRGNGQQQQGNQGQGGGRRRRRRRRRGRGGRGPQGPQQQGQASQGPPPN